MESIGEEYVGERVLETSLNLTSRAFKTVKEKLLLEISMGVYLAVNPYESIVFLRDIG